MFTVVYCSGSSALAFRQLRFSELSVAILYGVRSFDFEMSSLADQHDDFSTTSATVCNSANNKFCLLQYTLVYTVQVYSLHFILQRTR